MSNLSLLLITILAGLMTAGILWYAGKRRLFIVVPKLFAHSTLSSKSHTAELTVINRGYRSEELIKVELDPNLSYEQIASTDPSVALKGATLEIERVSANDDVTVLVLVEGGKFTKASIANISSRECKGNVVEKQDDVPLSFGSLVGGIAGLVIFASLFVLTGWVARSELTWNVFEPFGINAPVTPELKELGWENINRFSGSKLYRHSSNKEFPVTINEIRASNGAVEVDLLITNYATKRLKVYVALNTPGVDRGRIYSLILLPGQQLSRTLSSSGISEDIRVVVMEFKYTYDNEFVYDLFKEIELPVRG